MFFDQMDVFREGRCRNAIRKPGQCDNQIALQFRRDGFQSSQKILPGTRTGQSGIAERNGNQRDPLAHRHIHQADFRAGEGQQIQLDGGFAIIIIREHVMTIDDSVKGIEAYRRTMEDRNHSALLVHQRQEAEINIAETGVQFFFAEGKGIRPQG